MTLATRYYPYALTLQTGSGPAAPVVTSIVFEDVLLKSVVARIPPGARGAVGFYVSLAGTPIIPWGIPPSYLILDGETVEFDVNTETNQQITVTAYNTGAWPHTIYFRFAGTPVSLLTPAIPFVTIVPIQ